MKLFLVRHGESEANILRQISNRGLVHPLTARGRTEAEKLAGSLAGVEITSIYSSPLLRAQQTAEVLAGSAGLDVTVTDSLREFDCGVLEGRSDAEAWHQHSALMSAWADPQQWHRKIDGGESLIEVCDRLILFIEELLARSMPAEVASVLVGHGGIYQCALPFVLANVDASYRGRG